MKELVDFLDARWADILLILKLWVCLPPAAYIIRELIRRSKD